MQVTTAVEFYVHCDAEMVNSILDFIQFAYD